MTLDWLSVLIENLSEPAHDASGGSWDGSSRKTSLFSPGYPPNGVCKSNGHATPTTNGKCDNRSCACVVIGNGAGPSTTPSLPSTNGHETPTLRYDVETTGLDGESDEANIEYAVATVNDDHAQVVDFEAYLDP
jgi:hypothetical protein